MERAAYEVEARVRATHWWFTGRGVLFSRLLARLKLPVSARVLDVGSGTGSNLQLLRDMGFQQVNGLDASEDALQYCRQSGFAHVHLGDVNALPFPNDRFDLVLATDVLEHVDDDRGALAELARTTWTTNV
jgi:ubiquinone/menaquinone biosynthesis C-methylase UbiE